MNKLLELFGDRAFLFLDGGLGTMLQGQGIELGRVPEVLNITEPEIIRRIHRDYVEAGSDVINTCTFGVNAYKTQGCGYTVEALIKAAVANARAAAAGTQTKVALDVGPLGRLLAPNGDLPFETAYDAFRQVIRAGAAVGVDLITIETMTDLYEMKAALLAAKECSDLPVLCTMSFEANQRTFTGTQVSAMALTCEGLGADAVGMNCSLGPAEFQPLLAELSRWTTLPIVAKANAGLPDPATGRYQVTAETFAAQTADLIPYGVKLVGGCCGTTPDFIRALRAAFAGKSYRPQQAEIPAAVCTPERTVVIDQPRIIGERINPTGKKKLREALLQGDSEYVLAQAADQVRDGAEILDVNVGVPGIDEKKVMVNTIKALQGITDVPLQIDSNQPEVIEAALRVYCGKPIINSVTGEAASLEAILPLAKKYGAAVVGLTLDENGIPKTAAQRFAIAERILERALAAGIPRRDVYIDCLTLTVSAEQAHAAGTLEAIRRVKTELGLKTVLGVSNISYGLPNRGLINQHFLQMALTCGLDLPILNPGAADMVRAVDVYRLIWNLDPDARDYLAKYSRELAPPQAVGAQDPGCSTASAPAETGTLPTQDPLAYAVMNGLRGQCERCVADELTRRAPMEIIQDLLIPILDQAGRAFEAGTLFIPQLMLCASTAQAGFDVIKAHLAQSGGTRVSRGTVLIATVQGDIHDIGKNIVRVILENYGYQVVDLGKDVDPQTVADAVCRREIRLVGLSALMTTTLPAMAETIAAVKAAAPDCRVMVGGAVLTPEYAQSIGADYYVRDAMASVNVAGEVL